MFIKLRPYQEQAISKMMWARTLDGNDLISLPTGSGKSLVIAELVKKLNEPILILVPSKELLEQDLEKLKHWTDDVNIYSAGMNEKTVGHITLATIQSAYKVPSLFTRFKVVIIDEADLVNPKNLAGMYNKFFKEMGNPKIYGLTATPFRMDTIYKEPPGGWGNRRGFLEVVTTVKLLTRYKERFWSRMLYTAHTENLVNEGYLCPLTYHRLNILEQMSMKFNKSKSDFDLEDFEDQFSKYLEQVSVNVADMSGSVLVFCASVTQAQNLAKYIKDSVVVTGDTPAKERAKYVEGFKTGEFRVVINVGVLLVGFDKPNLENIVICRPTRSLRLHIQLLGRGMRRAPLKQTCHIFDLVGNVSFLGTAESMKVTKVNDKWDIVTSTFTEGLHLKELYTHRINMNQ